VASAGKDPSALKTIGELSRELGVAQHILRYWESRFPQLKPMQRAGNRRYYRPADVDLARRINRLLNEEGYTVRGVQKVLGGKAEDSAPAAPAPTPAPPPAALPAIDLRRLIALRNRLAEAIGD
jgi:DNA-binding transcriptional MerR regulator